MTNKSLSQQLCEACGIEPKGKLVFEKRNWDKKTWLSAGVGYKQFDFESTPNVSVDIIPTEFYNEKNGFQYPYSRIDEIKKLYDKNGYDFIEFAAKFIDFENNNNNFVKLLEIVSKKSSVSFCHNGTYYGCSIHYFFDHIFEAVEGTLQHNFLNTLLVQDLRNPCKPKLLEQIKQAIKNEQWEV